MNDASETPKGGPALDGDVHEIQGLFPSNATLEDGIARLTADGFDRADISIPDANPPSVDTTPEQGALNPNTETDDRQLRTLQTGLAASAGALAAAGAVIATGGAAAPAVAAAVAGGAGMGAAASGVSTAASASKISAREEAASRGELVLSVALRNASQRNKAEAAMWKAGAMRVAPVIRTAAPKG